MIPMPRLAFKPDASFFRKIVVGAVGARAVIADLSRLGHRFVELERGSTDTKLWKDVKRKRVRIPDLLCTNCGQRIECRAKTKLELAMSHSATDAERAWDFGMVDGDWIAFPVCEATEEAYWSSGALDEGISYWREKNWVRWRTAGTINYFTVAAFRSRLHANSRRKGVEEGSENVIAWDATFSTREGIVDAVNLHAGKVTIRRHSDDHRHTWSIKGNKEIVVAANDEIGQNQVIASAVPPIASDHLQCLGVLPATHLQTLLGSRERTQRFTGVKLARLLEDTGHSSEIAALAADSEEDVYVRLEAAAYLCSVVGQSAVARFTPFLENPDEQTQLEAVIALGETATDDAIAILSEIIASADKPFFLRSAAAWAMSQTGSNTATQQLIGCFDAIDLPLREEALDGLVAIGGSAIPALLVSLREDNQDIAAGCAEVLRRGPDLPKEIIDSLIAELNGSQPQSWAVWLVGHLPREQFAATIASLQQTKPELHYAVSLLWSFVESWIARNWELHPLPITPRD
jgi:hypothetical protein